LYPAADISLRTVMGDDISLIDISDDEPKVIGKVDYSSALWMVHTGAVYLQEAEIYLVKDLDLETHEATLLRSDLPYYTVAQKETSIESLEGEYSKAAENFDCSFGDIAIKSQVTGYKKILWDKSEVLGIERLSLPSENLQTKSCWIRIRAETISRLKINNAWLADENDYGNNWLSIREKIRIRDKFSCQVCGRIEANSHFHVHHIKPFKAFLDQNEANQPGNLITLCPTCHKLAEQNVRLRSSLAGVAYALHHMATLALMCDIHDIGEIIETTLPQLQNGASIVFFDQYPGGIGLSVELFSQIPSLIKLTFELIHNCECQDGCPSCVGPAGENGLAGKEDSLVLLKLLMKDQT
jgi:DEAD/DEAH box helicase domain-containing protein